MSIVTSTFSFLAIILPTVLMMQCLHALSQWNEPFVQIILKYGIACGLADLTTFFVMFDPVLFN